MKLNMLHAEQYIIYSSKCEGKIERYVDFIADFKDVQYALRSWNGTRHFGTPTLSNSLQHVLDQQCVKDSLPKFH